MAVLSLKKGHCVDFAMPNKRRCCEANNRFRTEEYDVTVTKRNIKLLSFERPIYNF